MGRDITVPQKGLFFFSFCLPLGTLLLCALLMYHIKLRQGKSVYYSNYYINGNISTAYFSIFFHIASGECFKGL